MPDDKNKGIRFSSNVKLERTYADRSIIEPVVVCHDTEHDIFLLRVGGRGVDHELSRREALSLMECLDAALTGDQPHNDE
jgi:hypothetical protein